MCFQTPISKVDFPNNESKQNKKKEMYFKYLFKKMLFISPT